MYNQETNQDQSRPDWLLSGGKINEVEFCRQFALKHSLVYTDGAFFGPEGRFADENILRRRIYDELRTYLVSGLTAKVEGVLNALRMECPNEGLMDSPSRDLFTIPVANGTYRVDLREFSEIKLVTRYRLPVEYHADAPKPERWLQFVSELLEEEDIPTLQEYMGYCLVPCTYAQKMLLITGKGGEGKSRIAVVMKALLGDNMNLNSIAKIESSPFARADLQHLLLMVDDDLCMSAMKNTNYLKSIISAELPMDLERKGIQSYQGKLNVRFMAFGNDTLQALHDRSNGFFRRQIILTAKEKPLSRKADPFLGYTLEKEKEGILLWCLEGLERLMVQDFQFTMSRNARQNILDSMRRGNSVPDFLKSEGYIKLDPEGSITSRLLHDIYLEWCRDNALPELNMNAFTTYLNQNTQLYQITPSRSIPIGNGKHARGYKGIRALSRF